jgi:hypothetical protein
VAERLESAFESQVPQVQRNLFVDERVCHPVRPPRGGKDGARARGESHGAKNEGECAEWAVGKNMMAALREWWVL